jgi:tetratricopeptide (TPR) repeat protein
MVSAALLKVPSKARKQYEKGNKLSVEKRWKEAAVHYQSAVALYPQFDVAYNALGVSRMNLDDAVGARQAFQNAIRVNPGLAPALRNLARLSLRAHDYAQADQLLKKSLASEPINPWALVSAAYAELQLNALDEAVANARRVHLLPHQGFEDAHIIAALALERKGETPQALAEYEMYLREAPTGASAAMARIAVARLSARSSQ